MGKPGRDRQPFGWAGLRQPLLAAASLLAGIASLSSGAARAADALYWVSDGHSIFPGALGRKALSGGTLEVLHTFPGDSLAVEPTDLEVDPTTMKMYWTDQVIGIRRANLDGDGIEDLITGIARPEGLALDLLAGKIYWCTLSQIYRANLDGTGQEVYAGIGGRDVDVDTLNAMIYRVGILGEIQRKPLSGGSFTTVVDATAADDALTIDLDPGNDRMFWTTDNLEGTVLRSTLAGSDVQTIIPSVGTHLAQVSADPSAQQIYLATATTNEIKVASYDGGGLSTFAAGESAGMIDVRGIDIGPLPEPCVAADGDNLTLRDDTVLDTQVFQVCETIEVGPNYQVAGPNGHLTLRAGVSVAFMDGASVGVDGTLIVENGLVP